MTFQKIFTKRSTLACRETVKIKINDLGTIRTRDLNHGRVKDEHARDPCRARDAFNKGRLCNMPFPTFDMRYTIAVQTAGLRTFRPLGKERACGRAGGKKEGK